MPSTTTAMQTRINIGESHPNPNAKLLYTKREVKNQRNVAVVVLGMEKLPGDYIAGFVDGEGCFALKFRRDVRHDRKNKPVYFYWDIEFAIMLREDDRDLLELIKETLGCGHISSNKRGGARYAVNNINELAHILVPFFKKYELRGKKRFDFKLWKEAVAIFKKNQRQKINRKKGDRWFHKTIWDLKDLERLKGIHQEMRKYKSKANEWKWLQ